MTARMMILNCVQETSVRAAVVLSVGLPRLVNNAWVVVAAVLSVVLLLLLDVEAGTPLAVAEVKVVLVAIVEGGDVLNMGASVVVVLGGVGRTLGDGRVQLCARASPVKPGTHSWHWGPVVLLMQWRQWPVSG